MTNLAQQATGQVTSWLGRLKDRISPGDGDEDQRWLVVTIDAPESEVAPEGQLPAPLAELGAAVEVRLAPAPGGRGTELSVRAAHQATAAPPPTGEVDVSRGHLRQALRQAKQLIEVGEVLVAEPRPEGRRPATVAGKLVDTAEQKSDQGGVL